MFDHAIIVIYEPPRSGLPYLVAAAILPHGRVEALAASTSGEAERSATELRAGLAKR